MPVDERRKGGVRSVVGREEFLAVQGSKPKLTTDMVLSAPTWASGIVCACVCLARDHL